MQHAIHLACLYGLIALLITAGIGDIRRFIIPNWLCASVAVLSIPYWLTSGEPLWPLLGYQVGLSLIAFVLFSAMFALGVMGGGDVKLFAALALWLPPLNFMGMLVVVALLGGVLTIILAVRHRLKRAPGRPQIPYGVAIVAGALLIVGEPIVKQFIG